jgi:DNA-binding transcriptional ArsR family regulator
MANRSVSLDSVFHALADPTRRAVIQRLGKGTATVSELAAPFDMALPSFVKHISVLEKSRLIVSRKNGRVRTCSLDHKNFVDAERWFDELRAQWSSRYDNLDNLLMKLTGDKNEA